MSTKLIKIEEDFYIVDDSRIKEGDYLIKLFSNKLLQCQDKTFPFINEEFLNCESCKDCFKVTHSTKQLDNVTHLNLLDVEEVICEYNVKDLANQKFGNVHRTGVLGFTEGFKTYQELVKDKLFTIEDMKYMFECGRNYQNNAEITFKVAINDILPKSQWNITIDSNNKITLI